MRITMQVKRAGARGIEEDAFRESAGKKRRVDARRVVSLTPESGKLKKLTSIWKDLLAGGIAGTAGIAIGYPFDTMKVRLQQQKSVTSSMKIPETTSKSNPTPFRGKNNMRNSSIFRGLYRGIGAPLTTAAIVNASVFSVYGATARLWDKSNNLGEIDNYSMATPSTSKHAVCGWVAGVATSLLICPIDQVAIQLQTMPPQQEKLFKTRNHCNSNAKTSFNVAKRILFSDHGLTKFYRGLSITMLRQAPSLAVYFPAYHCLKEWIDTVGARNDERGIEDKNKSLWWSPALAGGLAGCLAWTVIYPIDVVKSRIQALPMGADSKQLSIVRMARKISRNEGFLKLVFSRGLAVTLLRAIPVNGTIFCA